MTPNDYSPDKLDVFYVVDTETTGFDSSRCDVIEISALKVKNTPQGFVVKGSFDIYINPEYPLPPDIVAFNEKNQTGINDKLLARSPLAPEAAQKFLDFVGERPMVVGHNIKNFDSRFVNRLCMKGLDKPFLVYDYLDTLELARANEKADKKHSLSVCFEKTAKHHSAKCPKFHTAIADCYATLDVLEYLTEKYYKQQELEQIDLFGSFGTPVDVDNEKKAKKEKEIEGCYYIDDYLRLEDINIVIPLNRYGQPVKKDIEWCFAEEGTAKTDNYAYEYAMKNKAGVFIISREKNSTSCNMNFVVGTKKSVKSLYYSDMHRDYSSNHTQKALNMFRSYLIEQEKKNNKTER